MVDEDIVRFLLPELRSYRLPLPFWRSFTAIQTCLVDQAEQVLQT
jgi:hypothetical protein